MSEERKSNVERIQRLLDATMSPEEREQALASLTDAEREQYEALAWLKQRTGQALGGVVAPSGLEDRIRSGLTQALDNEVSAPAVMPPSVDATASGRPGWGVIGAALAALLVLSAVVVWQMAEDEPSGDAVVDNVTEPPVTEEPPVKLAETPAIHPEPTDPPAFAALVEVVAADVEAYRDGQFALEFTSEDSVAIQNYFAENGIPFHTRVFDLAMMEYQLSGGKTHSLDGKTSAAFAYHGPNGIRMLCQMYEGTIEDLPEAEDVREHNGIKFYSFQRGGVAMTFWREGDVICVLASMADLDEVVALAFAKAEKV